MDTSEIMLKYYCGRGAYRRLNPEFDKDERSMLLKMAQITGFSEEEIIRKAVRKYYERFTDGFNARVMVDELEQGKE